MKSLGNVTYLRYVPLHLFAQYLALGWTCKSNFVKFTTPAEASYTIIMEWHGPNPIEPEP